MPVVLLRKQINSLSEAREEISRLRQQLRIAEHTDPSFRSGPRTMNMLDHTQKLIAKNPDYAAQLIRIAESVGEPIKSHIHTIITNARKAHGK